MPNRNCPKCDADISESYEPDDWSVGISAGWFCDACDLGVGDDDIRDNVAPRAGEELSPTRHHNEWSLGLLGRAIGVERLFGIAREGRDDDERPRLIRLTLEGQAVIAVESEG